MRALTLIQPWATAVMYCGKDVENRTWAPSPKQLMPGQRFAIHAGAKADRNSFDSLLEFAMWPSDAPRWPLIQGVILGTVEFVGFFSRDGGLIAGNLGDFTRSKWRDPESKVWWCLDNPRPLTTPIPCKGALGLWNVPAEHLPALEGLVANV